jgi:hypothetical protein
VVEETPRLISIPHPGRSPVRAPGSEPGGPEPTCQGRCWPRSPRSDPTSSEILDVGSIWTRSQSRVQLLMPGMGPRWPFHSVPPHRAPFRGCEARKAILEHSSGTVHLGLSDATGTKQRPDAAGLAWRADSQLVASCISDLRSFASPRGLQRGQDARRIEFSGQAREYEQASRLANAGDDNMPSPSRASSSIQNSDVRPGLLL